MNFYINLDTDEEFQSLEELTDRASLWELEQRIYILEEKYKLANYGYNEAVSHFKKKQFISGVEFISQLYRNMRLINDKAFDALAVLLEFDEEQTASMLKRLGRILYDTHSYI